MTTETTTASVEKEAIERTHSKSHRAFTRNMRRGGKARLHACRALAYLMHDRVHLTYGQCVQALLTDYPLVYNIANSNIKRQNAAESDVSKHIALFDKFTYDEVFATALESAMCTSYDGLPHKKGQ